MEAKPRPLPAVETRPGCGGVDTLSRTPSRAAGRVHQPGSWTPKPAVASIGATCLRNRCAPAVSSGSSLGRVARNASSKSGYTRRALPNSVSRVSCGESTCRARARNLPRLSHTASASTTKLGSSLACNAKRSAHRCSSASAGSVRRKQARTGPATASRCHSARAAPSAATCAGPAAKLRSQPVRAASQPRVVGSPNRPVASRVPPSTARARASTKPSSASAQVANAVSGSAAATDGGMLPASVRAQPASGPVNSGRQTPRGGSTSTPGNSRPRATRSAAKSATSRRWETDAPRTTTPSSANSRNTAAAWSTSTASSGTRHCA